MREEAELGAGDAAELPDTSQSERNSGRERPERERRHARDRKPRVGRHLGSALLPDRVSGARGAAREAEGGEGGEAEPERDEHHAIQDEQAVREPGHRIQLGVGPSLVHDLGEIEEPCRIEVGELAVLDCLDRVEQGEVGDEERRHHAVDELRALGPDRQREHETGDEDGERHVELEVSDREADCIGGDEPDLRVGNELGDGGGGDEE